MNEIGLYLSSLNDITLKPTGELLKKLTKDILNIRFLSKEESIRLSFKNLVYLKVIFVIIIFLMSIYYLSEYGPVVYSNQSTPLIKTPQFFAESFLFSVCFVLSIMVSLKIRKNKVVPFRHILFSILILFIIINYLLEASGIMALFYTGQTTTSILQGILTPNSTNVVSKFSDTYSYIAGIVLLFFIFIPILYLLLASILNPVGPYRKSLFSIGGLIFLFELLIVCSLNTIPMILMAYNRDQLITAGYIFINFAILVVIFLVFQFSGTMEAI